MGEDDEEVSFAVEGARVCIKPGGSDRPRSKQKENHMCMCSVCVCLFGGKGGVGGKVGGYLDNKRNEDEDPSDQEGIAKGGPIDERLGLRQESCFFSVLGL